MNKEDETQVKHLSENEGEEIAQVTQPSDEERRQESKRNVQILLHFIGKNIDLDAPPKKFKEKPYIPA